jgi:hypothetical protein
MVYLITYIYKQMKPFCNLSVLLRMYYVENSMYHYFRMIIKAEKEIESAPISISCLNCV